jgi:Arc/MetJ family transcription regulator
MKTTIDIPERLLEEAMRNSKSSSKREAVLTALEEYNRKHQIERARAMLGTFKNMMSAEQIRELRNSRNKRHGLA